MILFSQRRKLGELYKQWTIDNHVLDCPSSVVDFLQIKGLLNEEKTHTFLAVKTNTVIDGVSNSSNHFIKEDTKMANNVVDLEKGEPTEVPAKTEKTNKEFFLKKWAKGAWHGVRKLGNAIKESPVTHFVMAGAGVAGTLIIEEVVRRKVNRSMNEDYEQEEPIEIEDSGEVISDLPEADDDEVTEE